MAGYEARLSRTNDCDDMGVVQIEETIRSSCDAIARWWDHLVVTTVKARTTGTIGRTDVRPAPVSDYILDLQRTTCEQLAGWAMVIAEERGLWPQLSGSNGPALARFVGNHYDWLARHEAGRDAAGEIAAKASLIRAAVEPHRAEEKHFVGNCECGKPVWAERGTEMVVCDCTKISERRKLRDQALETLRGQLLTAKECEQQARNMGLVVRANTITKRLSRKQIQNYAPEGETPLFAFGDVEAIAKPMPLGLQLAA